MISIVDDSESVREATKRLLRSLGYGVATFASAEDFLQSDQVNDTSCLITDVQMPGLSGVELQSHLIAQGNRMPTIFVTASTEEKTRARALKAGAIGFLTKPFNVDRLIEYIHMALADRKIGTVESLALGLAAPFGPARASAEGILGRAAPSPLSAETPAT
jgi:FixJ family two-component response regulator